MNDIVPSGFAGVRMREVTLESRDGTRIPVEEARASLRLWPLLLGRRSLAFDLRLFQGRLRGVVEEGRGVQRLALRAEGLDLATAAPLKQAAGGLDLSGVLRTDLDVTLDPKDQQKTAGRIELSVERAFLGGQLSIPGMPGGLTIPKASLGTVTGRATVKAGKAEFEKLEARGEDLEVTGEQLYFMVQPRLEFAPLYGRARVKIAEAFWQKAPALRAAAEAALATVAPGSRGDGARVAARKRRSRSPWLARRVGAPRRLLAASEAPDSRASAGPGCSLRRRPPARPVRPISGAGGRGARAPRPS
jgi:type II secretion system protein N